MNLRQRQPVLAQDPAWTLGPPGTRLPWDTSIGALLRRRAAERPASNLFRCSGAWRTFADVDAVTDRLAAGLAEMGVKKGDRVVIISANRDESIEFFFACA